MVIFLFLSLVLSIPRVMNYFIAVIPLLSFPIRNDKTQLRIREYILLPLANLKWLLFSFSSFSFYSFILTSSHHTGVIGLKHNNRATKSLGHFPFFSGSSTFSIPLGPLTGNCPLGEGTANVGSAPLGGFIVIFHELPPQCR